MANKTTAISRPAFWLKLCVEESEAVYPARVERDCGVVADLSFTLRKPSYSLIKRAVTSSTTPPQSGSSSAFFFLRQR